MTRSTSRGGRNLGGRNLGGRNLGGRNLGGRNLGGRNLGGRNLGGRNLGGRNLGTRHVGGRNVGLVGGRHVGYRGPGRMIGMPRHAIHNPARLGGHLGHRFGHRPAIVFRNGGFWRRSWYYGLVGGVLTWYWWDAPVLVDDPEVIGLAEVPSCLDTDDCPIVPMAEVRPRIVVPAVGRVPAAAVAVSSNPCLVQTNPATNMVSCTPSQSPAGACHLMYDYNDGEGTQDFGVSPPAEMPVAPNNEYTNSCVWMQN